MTKFRITYRRMGDTGAEPKDEEVEALMYLDEGDWIDFYKVGTMGGSHQHRNQVVLRVRASDVQRIEQVTS